MRWQIPLFMLLGLLAGCMNSQPRIDPFFGRQVIPPPGTGTAGTAILPQSGLEPPPASYYEGGGQLPRTSSHTSPTIDPYAPPGGTFEYQGTAARETGMTTQRQDDSNANFRPPNVARTQTSATSPNVSTTNATGVPLRATGPDDAAPRTSNQVDARSTDIRVNTNTSVGGSTQSPGSAPAAGTPVSDPYRSLPSGGDRYQNYPVPPATQSPATEPYPSTSTQPRRSASIAPLSDRPSVAFREPQRFTPEGEMRDIREASPSAARPSVAEDEPQLASHGMLRTASYREREIIEDDDRGAATVRPALPLSGSKPLAAAKAVPGPYGYDRHDYAWLKGKLEYSLAQRCWKLRYIPLTDPADAFGGSLILQETPELGDTYRPGDYVTVIGAISEEESGSGVAPRYEVHTLERTGK